MADHCIWAEVDRSRCSEAHVDGIVRDTPIRIGQLHRVVAIGCSRECRSHRSILPQVGGTRLGDIQDQLITGTKGDICPEVQHWSGPRADIDRVGVAARIRGNGHRVGPRPYTDGRRNGPGAPQVGCTGECGIQGGLCPWADRKVRSEIHDGQWRYGNIDHIADHTAVQRNIQPVGTAYRNRNVRSDRSGIPQIGGTRCGRSDGRGLALAKGDIRSKVHGLKREVGEGEGVRSGTTIDGHLHGIHPGR